jgi:uncharacterized membrane protein YphA (DoxX/SURF4 family)
MAASTSLAERPDTKISGNDRDFVHLYRVLNPFRYVRTASKAEFMDKLEWVLRLSVALCFIGHGFWGTVSKPGWVGLITPMGFSEATALALLPWIGWADIVLGVLVIYKPRSVLLWKAFLWACFTPLLRPLAGMSWFEVPERAGNYGIPLAFLVLAGGMGLMKTWWNGFEVIDEPESKLTDDVVRQVKLVLQISVGTLLVGHGGLMAVAQMPMYLEHFQAIGIPATQTFVNALGLGEMVLGIVVAVRPMAPVVWVVFFWKLFTESLFPIAGRPIDVFETIERWGDYGGCIALLLILHYLARRAVGPGGAPAPARAGSTA